MALCGLGGAGKTSVALEYAHRHLAEVGLAWQFPAEDPAVLAAGFGELAAQLGAGRCWTADPVVSVHGMLAASAAPWLLVFDNTPSRASVQPFVPPAGRGRVLITSRDQIWPPGQALEVPVLDQQVAAGFLADRTGDADRQAAVELAGELGGLPLALEQAAAYIQATGDDLAGYLASFRQRRADLLARGEPTGYRQTVATTWRLAFEHLQQPHPSAVGLLRLLANCAPEAIPLHLLLHPRPGLGDSLGPEIAPVLLPLLEDPLAAKDAVAALRRHSLISPPTAGTVSVHRLVQAVTIAQMPAELAAAWQQAAAAVIDAALPADPRSPDSWAAFASLLPHAQAALGEDSGSIWKIASYLGYSGNYPAARDLQQRVLKAQAQVSGPEHPDTLTARANLARWTGEAGDPAAARDLFAALLPVRRAGPRPGAPGHPGRPAQPRPLDRGGGGPGRRPGPVRRAAAGARAGPRPGAPGHPGRPRQPCRLDRGGGGPGRRPGPVRRAAAGARAGPRPGAPGHPGRPAHPRPLDRAGGGPGRRPGPVRRAAAGARAGPRPGAPGHPAHPRRPRHLDRGGGGPGRRPGPARRATARGRTGAPGAPGHAARPTRARPLDRGGRATRPPPGTYSPRCCRCVSGSSARSTRTH